MLRKEWRLGNERSNVDDWKFLNKSLFLRNHLSQRSKPSEPTNLDFSTAQQLKVGLQSFDSPFIKFDKVVIS